MDLTAAFEEERPQLLRVAARMLGDPHEAQDVVQNAWIRMYSSRDDIRNLPAWLTTVTTRLCLDRLRLRVPLPTVASDVDDVDGSPDPLEEAMLAETVGVALQVLLDRLTPTERVAFVLHDCFGFDFVAVGDILGRTPQAARKLASRARGKVVQIDPGIDDQRFQADAMVVDAFLAAARGGRFAELLTLLAPAVTVDADAAAIELGTPVHIEGGQQVAQFFNGAAKAAVPVIIGTRPGAAWFHRGEARVAFEFSVDGGMVQRITFRADPSLLADVRRRGIQRQN